MEKRLAFTTTIPVEVVLAAGYRPVDLNNVFVSSPDAPLLVEQAEIAGFPRSCCAWIKGIFEAFKKSRGTLPIDVFVAVTEGDCSNARVLKELIDGERGAKSYLFPFPQDRSSEQMRNEIEKFAAFLGTTSAAAEQVRHDLRPLRKALERLDELSWRHPGLVKGIENHLMLVSASDFNGDPVVFREEAERLVAEKEKLLKSGNYPKEIRPLAYLGVPPIFDLYSFLEEKGGVVVFNEIQREFAMPGEFPDLAAQYLAYSYPYSAEYRFSKAIKEIQKRKVAGIIHYVQSFCHRQIEDIILRRMVADAKLGIPIITIEGDKPQNELDGRQKTRLEAFIETL